MIPISCFYGKAVIERQENEWNIFTIKSAGSEEERRYKKRQCFMRSVGTYGSTDRPKNTFHCILKHWHQRYF